MLVPSYEFRWLVTDTGKTLQTRYWCVEKGWGAWEDVPIVLG